MSWVLISDLHLSDDPADEYRWGLFRWLTDKLAKLSGKKTLFLLGDLTQEKDRHSAKLVNRTVKTIADLRSGTGVEEIVILRGNHDGLGDVAYFDFLNEVPHISVITKPCIKQFGLRKVALLPHTRDVKDWATVEFGEVGVVMMHQTVTGSVAESGTKLEGDKGFDFLQYLKAEIYSGDIHVPQKVGKIEYVGAPYPVRFGDKYKGRVLVIDGFKKTEWFFPTIKKAKVILRPGKMEANPIMASLEEGDQAKFELQLARSEMHQFHDMKEAITNWCQEKGVVLCGVNLLGKPALRLSSTGSEEATPVLTTIKAMEAYCQRSKTPEETVTEGRKLLFQVNPALQVGSGSTQILRLRAEPRPKFSFKAKS